MTITSWNRKNLLNPVYWPSAIAIASFIILIFTGILLCFWYEPSPEKAYESILYTSRYVYFGQILLSLHHWATDLLIISILLHMIRTFFMGTYKHQRYAWISGAFLLIITILFIFSGYLLRWDEVGYWSIRITTSIVGYTPLIGDYLEEIILGGSTITSRTLVRFYMIHVSLLPILSLVLLMGMHYSVIRKLRIYWVEIGIAMIAVGFLMLYSVLDPFQLAPKPSAELKIPLKPPWLFLWLYVIERGTGMISPMLNFLNIIILITIASLITLLPYIDKTKETEATKKRRTIIGVLVIALFLVLTVIGYLWKPPIPT